MAHIKISRANLLHNISTIASRCGIDKFAAVLKDNAYGHGLLECAKICSEAGVKYAVVRDNDEAESISQFFQLILVLADAKTPTASNIHIVVNSLKDLDALNAGTKVHIKLDSGMHRNGIDETQIDPALEKIKSNSIIIAGVMTHLRSADELSSETFWQTKNFERMAKKILDYCESNKLAKPMVHLHNSAGVFRRECFRDVDMVRVGIAMYGYVDMPTCFDVPDLKPVMSLYAKKISDRVATSNQRPGYGGGGLLKNGTQSSVYNIGYADGFFRIRENSKYILPNGSKIVGRVSMDNMIVDCSEDEVCLFDDARELAKMNNTITYDVMVKLSSKIKRIVV